jgi:hypothetical protein
LVGVKKEKDLSKQDSEKLPQPTGWRILVLPFKMKEKTKGGLIMAETTFEKEQVASQTVCFPCRQTATGTRIDILKVLGAKKGCSA